MSRTAAFLLVGALGTATSVAAGALIVGCDTGPATCTCSVGGTGAAATAIACGASACVGGVGYQCVANNQTSAAPEACPNWSLGTGGATGMREVNLTVDGEDRLYGMYVPPTYTGQKGVPFLMHFHGWRSLPAGVTDEIDYVWKDVADAQGFLVAALEGLPCGTVNGYDLGGAGCFQEDVDATFVDAVLDATKKQYNIDLDRLYLSGHSGGSYFVEEHGLTHSDKFAGVVEHSGGCSTNFGPNLCSRYSKLADAAARKIPFFQMHHPNDKIVPFSWDGLFGDLLDEKGFPHTTYYETYDAGSSNHSIDPKVEPTVWAWLSQYALP